MISNKSISAAIESDNFVLPFSPVVRRFQPINGRKKEKKNSNQKYILADMLNVLFNSRFESV